MVVNSDEFRYLSRSNGSGEHDRGRLYISEKVTNGIELLKVWIVNTHTYRHILISYHYNRKNPLTLKPVKPLNVLYYFRFVILYIFIVFTFFVNFRYFLLCTVTSSKESLEIFIWVGNVSEFFYALRILGKISTHLKP